MGSGQSSDTTTGPGGSTSAQFNAMIREMDYYKLVQAPRNATAAELKKAYRKMALRLHPDRNLGQEEEATVLFAKVQAAYDVLADPQERAYYDQYGPRGRAGASQQQQQQEEEFVPRFMSADELKEYIADLDMFKGTGNGGEPKFYKVAGDIFKRLAREEIESQPKFDPMYEPLPTRFGTSKTDYLDELEDFYKTWLAFSSVKSFSWVDKYDTKYAEDRRTRRAMDAANNKVREAARRQFNAAVKAFVTFIRKNDPRYRRYAGVSATSEAVGSAKSKSAKQQSQEERKRNAAARGAYEEQEWEKMSKEDFDEFFSESEEEEEETGEPVDESANPPTTGVETSESEEEGVEEVFECVVCDKTFKTQKQLVAHERSKKHLRAVDQLKEEMRKEGIELGFDEGKGEKVEKEEEKDDSDEEDDSDDEDEDDDDDEHYKPTTSGFGALMESDDEDEESEEEPHRPVTSGFSALMEDSDSEEESEEGIAPNSKATSGFSALMSDSEDDSEEEPQEPEPKPTPEPTPKSKSKSKSKDQSIRELLEQLEKTRAGSSSGTPTAANSDEESTKKPGKAKQRKMKKNTAGNSHSSGTGGAVLRCNVCGQDFASKNKLFDHIRHTGHAVLGGGGGGSRRKGQ